MVMGGIILNKRAQFFLLAAVIISAVVISLGIASNVAIINNEPNNFYDFSYEVKKEVGAIIDYEIYTEIISNDELLKFINFLAIEAREKNPDADFLFIYGNKNDITIKNYGAWDVDINGIMIQGIDTEDECKIWLNDICVDNSDYNMEYVSKKIEMDDHLSTNEKNDENGIINAKIGEYEFKFPVSEYSQIIFIMQKDVNNESFVTTT